MSTPLYIVDFSNFAYKFKAVHTYAKQEVAGVSVDLSVFVGFIRSLKQNLFQDIAIVLDGKPVESLKILPGYKGQRQKESNDVIGVSKLELIQFLTKVGTLIGKNVFVCCAPCQEADQAIASMVHIISRSLPKRANLINRWNSRSVTEDPWLANLATPDIQQCEVSLDKYDSAVIGTTDSDMKALTIYSNVYIDTSTSGKAVRAEDTAKAVGGVNPFAIPIYKAIYGDVSDNVPGYEINRSYVELLDKLIKSDGDKEEFINRITTKNLGYVDKMTLLCSIIIKEDGGKKFLRNLDVVELRYYSNPKVLSYPDYDINKTLKKYSLRV